MSVTRRYALASGSVLRARCQRGPAAGPDHRREPGGTAARFPDQEALVVGPPGLRRTYGQLGEVDRRVRPRAARRRVEPGDRVGIWCPNSAEWVIVQYATAKIGAILVNLNPAYRTSEVQYVLASRASGCWSLAPAFKQLGTTAR